MEKCIYPTRLRMNNLFTPPVIIPVSTFIMIVFYFTVPQLNYITFPLNLSGLLISFAGFVIMGKARNLHKKYNTTLTYEQPTHLITEGVFSKTRNPMYCGMFLLLLGISIVSRNLLSVSLALLFWIISNFIFIPAEERSMSRVFGKDYDAYRMKVRRWF